ncbi:glycoside hydrolase family 113 [Heyndrickxia acidiproducens]|uniref:glycoside hydrolase family 113 n=1 Tax=Heyndrickxia acidiproducens TaxID=1121084 RepID=UPI000379DDCB|nr:hypothetical protein [Heyndrickxia acidiproducens]
MAIPSVIKDLANKVRTAVYGKDVRESIAKSMETTSDVADQAKTAAEYQIGRVDNLIRNNPQPSEVVDLRYDTEGVEHPTASARAASDYNKVTAQLAETSSQLNVLNQTVLPHKLTYKTVSITTGMYGTQKPGMTSWQHIAKQGAHATLCVMVNVTSDTDVSPQMIPDDLFNSTLLDAKSNNVPIDMVKLHIGLNWSDGYDRGNYHITGDDVATFFTNWQSICLHYADLCIKNDIPLLCVGCEQYNQTHNSLISYWQALVDAVRSAYPSLKLLYAPKWWEAVDAEKQQIHSLMDYIGANCYLCYQQEPLSEKTPIIDEITKAFYYQYNGVNYAEALQNLSIQLNKKVFITEIGCMPIDTGLQSVTPPNYSTATQNYDAVTWLMKAAFSTLFRLQCIDGFAWWHVDSPFKYFNDSETTTAEQFMIDYVKGGLI